MVEVGGWMFELSSAAQVSLHSLPEGIIVETIHAHEKKIWSVASSTATLATGTLEEASG